jgi:hypothetical protein
LLVFVGAVDDATYAGSMDDLERRSKLMRRARFFIRLERRLAFAAALVVGLWFVAFPVPLVPDPVFYGQPNVLGSLLSWAAYVGVIVGLVATARLSRIDPEAGERTWRYRDY